MTRRFSPAGTTWIAFGLLMIYGTLRWGTMLEGGDRARVFLALLIGVISAAAARWLLARAHRRWTVPGLGLLALVGMIGLAGYPWRWLYGLKIARFSASVRHGIASLPDVLVPYRGHDSRTAAVLILGAALLLLLGSLAFASASARRRPASGALALTALPLGLLAIVPSAIVRPSSAYLHGVIAFGLIALLVLSPRLVPRRGPGALGLTTVAVMAGAALAAGVAGGGRWVDVATGQARGGGSGGGTASFDWQQTYGDLGWPHTGTVVMTVAAQRAAYWKAEDLDDFDGVRWATGSSRVGLTGISAANLAAYTENVAVSVGAMSTSQVIAAGYAYPPRLFGTSPSSDPGTWVTNYDLDQGNSYTVRVYAPDPSAAQLERAGADFPSDLAPFRTTGDLPSAYDGVRAIADKLAAGTTTPYEYSEAVMRFLRSGYVYTRNPPSGGRYSLAGFLLRTKQGYCQQFAGAMALLLRMHGVPARVAVGFTPGSRTGGNDTYTVTDLDAHAWVEEWFPQIGWVTFDPTPPGATGTGSTAGTGLAAAAAGLTSGAAKSAGAGQLAGQLLKSLSDTTTTPSPRKGGLDGAAAGGASAGTGLGGVAIAGLVLGGLILGGLLIGAIAVFWRRPTVDQLTSELERAFLRAGRPLAPGLTLAGLAAGLEDAPRAAAYVNALAAARFAPEAPTPPARGRAALRRWLARRPGATGARRLGGPLRWLRALSALPPRRAPRGIGGS